MTKKFLSLLLSTLLILSVVYVVPVTVTAHQDYSTGLMTFDNYEYEDALYDSANNKVTMPTATKGTIKMYQTQTANSYVQSGKPTSNSKYGNSIEVVAKYNANASTLPGFSWHYGSGVYMTDTIHIKASFYIKDTKSSPNALIRLRGNASSSSRAILLLKPGGAYIHTDAAANKICDISDDAWYDVDIVSNVSTAESKILIYKDNVLLGSKEASTEVLLGTLTGVERVEFMSTQGVKNAAYSAEEPAYTYWDNLLIESDYDYAIDPCPTVDFTGYSSNITTTTPATPSGVDYTLKLGNPVENTDGAVSYQEDNGNIALKLMCATKGKYPDFRADFNSTTSPQKIKVSFRAMNYDMDVTKGFSARVRNTDTSIISTYKRVDFLTIEGWKVYNNAQKESSEKTSSGLWYNYEVIYDSVNQTIDLSVTGNGLTYTNHKVLEDATTYPKSATNYIDYIYFWLITPTKEDKTSEFYLDDVRIETLTDKFALNESKSTTGANAIVYEDAPVKAVFTHPLDETNESLLGKLSVATGDTTIESVTLSEDKMTAIINFAKVGGKHYDIKFTDVLDTSANKISGHLEFDVIEPDLVIGTTAFDASDVPAAGTVKATYSLKSNNGKQYSADLYVAAYNGTELIKLSKSESPVVLTGNGVEETPELSVTYTAEDNITTIKAFIWSAGTLNPLANSVSIGATQTPS